MQKQKQIVFDKQQYEEQLALNQRLQLNNEALKEKLNEELKSSQNMRKELFSRDNQLSEFQSYKQITWEMEREIQELRVKLEQKNLQIEQQQSEVQCVKQMYSFKKMAENE
jgi:hypothetical protein